MSTNVTHDSLSTGVRQWKQLQCSTDAWAETMVTKASAKLLKKQVTASGNRSLYEWFYHGGCSLSSNSKVTRPVICRSKIRPFASFTRNLRGWILSAFIISTILPSLHVSSGEQWVCYQHQGAYFGAF